MNSSRAVRHEELTHLIRHLRFWFERLKAVRESFWNVNSPPVAGAQVEALPLPERGRVWPDIDNDVEDAPLSASNEFRFLARSDLEMHPSQRSLLLIEGHVALNEGRVEAVLFEFPLTPGSRKEAPFVLMTFGLSKPGGVEFCWEKTHDAQATFTSGIGMMNWPPWSRYFFCWARISSAKFQVSSRQ